MPEINEVKSVTVKDRQNYDQWWPKVPKEKRFWYKNVEVFVGTSPDMVKSKAQDQSCGKKSYESGTNIIYKYEFHNRVGLESL